jgi:hypothetical protein
MRPFAPTLIIVGLLFPVVSQAAITWSTCGTVTSVSNYIANDNSFYVTLSGSAIPSSCTAISSVPGSVGFVVGSDGVTSTNQTALLASALSAMATGQQVMIAYDNSTSSCNGQVISIGGYSAQCPQ